MTLAYIGIICSLLGFLASLLVFLAYYSPRYGVVLVRHDGGVTLHNFYRIRSALAFARQNAVSVRHAWLHDSRDGSVLDVD